MSWIKYYEKSKQFELNTFNTTYVFTVFDKRYPVHVYYGPSASISQPYLPEDFNSFSPNPNLDNKTYSLDTIPLEISSHGNSDFRVPSIQIKGHDGSRLTDFRVIGHEISNGVYKLDSLPCIKAGEHNKIIDGPQHLKVFLEDKVAKLKMVLHYTVLPASDVIVRSTQIINESDNSVKIEKCASLQIDFEASTYELIHLQGAWARERSLIRTPINRTSMNIQSRRGASGHHENPFMALVSPHTTEFHGEVYGFNLIYSGNFSHEIEVSPYDNMRVVSGVNAFQFEWSLGPSETFESPQAIMTFSQKGLNGMSQNMHHLIHHHIIPQNFYQKKRPILINNWEATYFDFTEDKLKAIIEASNGLGIELFVLDDGWFGKRNSDQSGLGDWEVNLDKLPNGLKALGDKAGEVGMKFGLWVEPEMVSPDSDIYRMYPDDCLHVPNRERTEGRNQLVLDLSRLEVADRLYERLFNLFDSSFISYVKWDMNRNMTEVYSKNHQQGEVIHRYYINLYRILDKLTQTFPHILFESCSGGGGRFDLGMLTYMPQTWTSDNTDAYKRLQIQYATSLAYPISSMGAHVSDVPNHQTGRKTSLHFRSHVAMSGNLGYELDATKLSSNERQQIANVNMLYNKYRHLFQWGSFYRIKSPFDSQVTVWCFKAEKTLMLMAFRGLKEANIPMRRVHCPYAELNKMYAIVETSCEDNTPSTISGSELAYRGIYMPHSEGDFVSAYWIFEEVES